MTETQKEQLAIVGKNIKAARIKKKWSGRELARRTGLHLRSIQKIEGGEISVLFITLIRVKKALRIPWNEMMRGTV